MGTRSWVLLAALCALPFATGCGAVPAPDEPISTRGEEPKAKGWDLPVAPAPRAKKTTAELLVGTWRAIELNGKKVPKEWVYRFTFTPEGRIHTFAEDDPGRPRTRSGAYSLDGNKLLFQFTAESGDRIDGEGTLTEVNEARLVFTDRFDNHKRGTVITRRVLEREPAKGQR